MRAACGAAWFHVARSNSASLDVPSPLPFSNKLADIYGNEQHPNFSFAAAADVLKHAVAICDMNLDDAVSEIATQTEREWQDEAGDAASDRALLPASAVSTAGSSTSIPSVFAPDGRRSVGDWDGAEPPSSAASPQPFVQAPRSHTVSGAGVVEEHLGAESSLAAAGVADSVSTSPDATGSIGVDVGGASHEGSEDSARPVVARTLWTQTPLYLADALMASEEVRKRRVRLADALTRLSQVYSRQGQHFYVEPLLLRAIELLETSIGRHHMEVCSEAQLLPATGSLTTLRLYVVDCSLFVESGIVVSAAWDVRRRCAIVATLS